MSREEFARWLCLLEGIDIIFDKTEELGVEIDLIRDKKLHKRLKKALDDFIKERFHAMYYDVSVDTKETAQLLRILS